MTNGDEPINPDAASNIRTKKLEFGLTKREYFAAMAMQGLNAAEWCRENQAKTIATLAVNQADALIEALNKE